MSRASDFFSDYALFYVAEWRNEPTNLRRALTSVLYLSHTADWYLHEHAAPKIGDLYNELEGHCPDFGILVDVANATKHLKLDRPNPRRDAYVTSAGAVDVATYRIAPANLAGTYQGGVIASRIIVELTDDTTRDLAPIIDNVTEMWRARFGS
jgi:hypothetical protein